MHGVSVLAELKSIAVESCDALVQASYFGVNRRYAGDHDSDIIGRRIDR